MKMDLIIFRKLSLINKTHQFILIPRILNLYSSNDIAREDKSFKEIKKIDVR